MANENKSTKDTELTAGVKTQAELVAEEIARNEEYVEITLFRDNDRYSDDLFVSVGNENCVIKRGVPVRVKRKFALVIEQQHNQDMMTAAMIEREKGKASEAALM